MVVLIIVVTGALTFYFMQEDVFRIDPEVQLQPEREYQLTYWDYPLFIGQEEEYTEFLEEAIADFNDMYPNIKVDYEILSFLEGESRLQERLKEGNPPDIYNDIFGSKFFSEELQIPVNIYFAEGDLGDYNQAAIKSFYADQRVWGLPNWVLPQVWVGNKSLLTEADLDLNEIQTVGWDWQQFSEVAQQINDLGRDNSIIFNPHNSQLLFHLLSQQGREQFLCQEEGLLLEAEELKLAFQFLRELQEKQVFPESTQEMNKQLLPDFWQGQAGVIAPINMWLLNNFYQREAEQQRVDLTLIPPPGIEQQEQLPLEVGGLVLFRQQEYQGHEHSKATYKFAEFINRQKNLFLAEKLKVVPAYLPLQSLWAQEVDLRSEIKEDILSYAQRGTPKQLDSFASLAVQRQIEELLAQAYQDFWLTEKSIAEIVNEVMTESQQLVAAQREEE